MGFRACSIHLVLEEAIALRYERDFPLESREVTCAVDGRFVSGALFWDALKKIEDHA